ncbi:DUF4184 family protein [Microbacterium sp. NPDC056234]|uniref:DUF4184 family protein n=1 Tax=Microbacterium sp. NPDC056234 TaxID=3345757 RepID=UPI0035D53230
MPFTPSHAVVALPFIRTPLIPSAIAIGAMTPDLPLFVRGVGLEYGFTHTGAHIVWTGLIAFVLFLVWRVLLRPSAAELSPTWAAARLPREWNQTPWAAARQAVGAGERRWYPLLLAASLLIGVASHILWDLFTHEDRWGSEVLPILDAQWGPLQGFKWLQHGSSALGLIIIGIWMLMWLRRRTPREAVERLLPGGVRVAWWLSLPAVLVVAWGVGLVAYGPLTEDFTVQHLAYRVLPPACAVWGMITVALCVVVGVRRTAR